MFPNWAKSILFLLVYMISGLILVIIIEGLLTGTELTPLNTVIEQIMTHIRTPFLTTMIVVITKLSDPFVLSFAAALIAALLVMQNRRYDAMLIIVSLVVAVISLTVLKNTFQITRPHSEFITDSGWSFPSGHATVATTFFFILSHSFWRKMKTNVGKSILIAGSILSVTLICISRLYLGAHWALDILGGIALGLLSVSFTVLVLGVFVGDRESLRNRINLL